MAKVKNDNISQELIYYLVIGGLATIFNYLVFVVLYKIFNIYEVFSSAIAYMSGVLVSYPLNVVFTFKKRKKSSLNLIVKYISVYLVTLIVGCFIFYLLLNVTKLSPYIIQAIQICFVTVLNYMLLKLVVFKAALQE